MGKGQQPRFRGGHWRRSGAVQRLPYGVDNRRSTP